MKVFLILFIVWCAGMAAFDIYQIFANPIGNASIIFFACALVQVFCLGWAAGLLLAGFDRY